MNKLNDSSLFRQQAHIDGAWIGADSGATFTVSDPANGETIGCVPDMGVAETARAIAAADAALPAWRRLLARDRSAILRRWYGIDEYLELKSICLAGIDH